MTYQGSIAQTDISRIIYSIIAFAMACVLLYVSVFLSQRIKYNGSFASAFPFILPLVFAMALIGISVLFIVGREYPWLLRTGIMSLVIGIALPAFGMITYHINAEPALWAGSTGLGLLFIIAAIIRLIIQGGLSAYRKAKN